MTTTRIINYNDDIYIDVMHSGCVVSIINATKNYYLKMCEFEQTHETICRYGNIMQVIDCWDDEKYPKYPMIQTSCYEHDWDLLEQEYVEPNPYDGTYSEV